MKAPVLGFFFLVVIAQLSFGQPQQQQQRGLNPPDKVFTVAEQELLNLSKDKWQWMSDKNADKLADLFHEKSMFVHMGGSWGKEQEVNIIKSGGIWYRKPKYMKRL